MLKTQSARQLGRKSSDGFILVAVFWILGGLAVLAAVYALYVVNAAASQEVNNDRIQADASVTAALELTAYYLGAVKEARAADQRAIQFPRRRLERRGRVPLRAARGSISTRRPSRFWRACSARSARRPMRRNSTPIASIGWRTPAIGAQSRPGQGSHGLSQCRTALRSARRRRSPTCRNSGWCSACRRLWSSARCPSSPCSAVCPASTSWRPRRRSSRRCPA